MGLLNIFRRKTQKNRRKNQVGKLDTWGNIPTVTLPKKEYLKLKKPRPGLVFRDRSSPATGYGSTDVVMHDRRAREEKKKKKGN